MINEMQSDLTTGDVSFTLINDFAEVKPIVYTPSPLGGSVHKMAILFSNGATQDNTAAGLLGYTSAAAASVYSGSLGFARNLIVNSTQWGNIMGYNDSGRPIYNASQPQNAGGAVSAQSINFRDLNPTVRSERNRPWDPAKPLAFYGRKRNTDLRRSQTRRSDTARRVGQSSNARLRTSAAQYSRGRESYQPYSYRLSSLFLFITWVRK